ncbi:hypothetical protein ACLKA7_006666 [Drosophila subpalustris]
MNSSGLYASYVKSKYIGMQHEEANLFVLRALHYVIREVFAQLSSTLVITASSRDKMMFTWFEYVLSNLVSMTSDAAVQVLHINGSSPVRVPGRKYCNLILIDAYESLRDTMIAVDNAGYDNHEYYFIFLQTCDVFIQHELELILKHCLAHYWLNCNVMVQTAKVEVLIYSYYPYREQHCQTAQPELVNRFDGHRMINDPMFPNKLTQMHQCPLTLALWHMPPYVELSWDNHTSQLLARGFEVLLVNHLAQHLNFTLVLLKLNLLHVDKYQLALANGAEEGPIELLMQQRANLSIGYFRKTARRDQLMTSPPAHYYVPLVATVELEYFRFGHWALLTFPFQAIVWRTLLAALLLHWSVYMWRWRGMGGQVLELLLGVALARLPRSWMQRIIYVHWLLGSIPLRIVYQSLLFHFMRLQLFETLPSSFEQLLGSNFHAICTSNTHQMLREMQQVERNLESFTDVASAYDEDVLDALHRANGRRMFAITGIDVTKAHLRDTSREVNYYILPQFVNVQQVAIYMPKHSYFHKQFTDLIRRLDASGFIAYWRRSAFAEYGQRYGQNQRNQEQLHRDQQRRIHKTQLSAIYSVMGVLYGIAALVFCAELLFYHLINTPTVNSSTPAFLI